MRIETVPNNKVDSISSMVPQDVYEKLKSESATALVAVPDEGCGDLSEDAYGVLVYFEYILTQDPVTIEMLVDSLFVKEEFRNQGIATLLLDAMEKYLQDNFAADSVSVNLIIPEQQAVADLFVKRGYVHRADGNKIYRIDVDEIFSDLGLMKMESAYNRCSISSFDQTPNVVLNRLYKKFDDEIPGYLNPSGYGGVIQDDLCFVVADNDEPKAFLATSLFPDGELLLGGLYVERQDAVTAAGLLWALMNALARRDDVKTLVFAAATEEGEKLAGSALRNFKGILSYQVVSNYYKDIF